MDIARFSMELIFLRRLAVERETGISRHTLRPDLLGRSRMIPKYDSGTIFRAVEMAVRNGPIDVDRLGELVQKDPTQLLADLMREAGNRGYVLRCTFPYGTITGLDEIQ